MTRHRPPLRFDPPAPPPPACTIDVDAVIAGLTPVRPRLSVEIRPLPLKVPFHISYHVFNTADTIVVRLEADGFVGEGEAAGVFYLGDDPAHMVAQLEAGRPWITQELDHAHVQNRLPPGGARNALDCALWQLQARRAGQPLWRLLGMDAPKPLLTTFTIGADTPERMAAGAIAYHQARALKLKLSGSDADGDRVRAVRSARPDVLLAVDANRALTAESLTTLLPALKAANVKLVEQPFAVAQDRALEGLSLPMPVAADESVQGLLDIARTADRYDMVNIKLDKCGGLTEALLMVQAARRLGMGVMVGNMLGSSMAMAPAFLVGQYCDIVDLDGPVFLRSDPGPSVTYENGMIDCPGAIWAGCH
jgi:L-alanine-DL-glutamate epimerase-like enolase superfamily enzyme